MRLLAESDTDHKVLTEIFRTFRQHPALHAVMQQDSNHDFPELLLEEPPG